MGAHKGSIADRRMNGVSTDITLLSVQKTGVVSPGLARTPVWWEILSQFAVALGALREWISCRSSLKLAQLTY
jgi:hypothetical protein